jgi:hypothetical protein
VRLPPRCPLWASSHVLLFVRETRHPNVVLYLGLSRAPDPDGRIFIVSEFIDNGASVESFVLVEIRLIVLSP